ncbi:hypothetical protein FOZ63_003944 [Perkinsus olseni]|uniref:Sorl1p n=1 Tax=Perkinsus olseni TaxID=32597 RepID=A0A7J6RVJ5_PEROL|nr:hypothetical protein FOZ63_003944 [Perkinsus olseni]
MRSTFSRPIGLLTRALLLLTVGATRDDYACHFPDDPHQPISCLVSAVKESIVFDRSNYRGPYYYLSEHTMTTDQDGMKRYASVTCKVARVRREKRKFFEPVGSCDMEWLRGAGLVAYTAKPNGYMVHVARGDGNEARYFKRLTAKRVADTSIPRHGNKGDVVAAYVNDEPEGWEVHVSLGAKVLLSKKRKAHAVFYVVKQGHRWSLPSALSGPYYEVMLDGINNGEAFFFKHGSNHRPGEYATFLTMSDKVYLLFDTPDRNSTWVIETMDGRPVSRNARENLHQGFSGMRSCVFRSVGLVIGALLLLTVGATRDDYACHFPDDPHQPISCLVSAVKESIVFDVFDYQGPYYYSEHTMTTDEDGIKRYSSVTCTVIRDRPSNSHRRAIGSRREKRKFFKSTGSCDIEWLRGAGLIAYIAGSNGYMVDVPRGDGVVRRHFKKLTVKELCELRLPRRGNRGDLVATYVNDEPERWEAHVSLRSRFFLSHKRKARVKFYRVDGGHRWIVPDGVLRDDNEVLRHGPNFEMLIGGIDDGKAFFFKHGSFHRPGEYAAFVTMFDKVYLLFETPDRNNTEPDFGTAPEHTCLWDPPPRYRDVSESCCYFRCC